MKELSQPIIPLDPIQRRCIAARLRQRSGYAQRKVRGTNIDILSGEHLGTAVGLVI